MTFIWGFFQFFLKSGALRQVVVLANAMQHSHIPQAVEDKDLLPVLYCTECHLTSFLKEFGPSRALDFLLIL